MPISYEDFRAGFERMGIPPPDAFKTTPEPVTAEPGVSPLTPTTAPPVPRAPMPARSTTPPTQAYTLIDAALRLSAAVNGAPVVERSPEGFVITVHPRLRLAYTAHQLAATVITWQVRDNTGWRTFDRQHYPKLTPAETGRILVWYWLGETP